MTTLISIPILLLLLILQTAVLSQMPLLRGFPDLVLLAVVGWALQKRVTSGWNWAIIAGVLVGFVSAMPFGTALGAYLACTGLALALRQRLWRAPLLAMLILTFVSSLLSQAIFYIVLRLAGSPLPLGESFNLILLPSLLLNLVFAVPIFAVLGEVAHLLHPEEIVV